VTKKEKTKKKAGRGGALRWLEQGEAGEAAPGQVYYHVWGRRKVSYKNVKRKSGTGKKDAVYLGERRFSLKENSFI